MINKNINKIALVAAAFVVVLAIPAFAGAQAASTAADGTSAAVTNDSNVNAPSSTDGSGTNAGIQNIGFVVPPPSGDGDATNAAVSNDSTATPPPSTDGTDTNGGVTVTPPVNTDGGDTNGGTTNNGTGSTITGGSSTTGGSSSSGGAGFLGATGTSSCPLITSFMKFGFANDTAQVAKLQAFFNSQGIATPVTGIFDAQTVDSTKAFQSRYLSEVMGPWGASQSSGFVYITTLKKVNELACKQPFALTAAEQAIIANYKARVAAGETGLSPEAGPTLNGTSTTSSTTEIGATDNGNGSQTAAVGNLSIFQRFWNFIISLFK